MHTTAQWNMPRQVGPRYVGLHFTELDDALNKLFQTWLGPARALRRRRQRRLKE